MVAAMARNALSFGRLPRMVQAITKLLSLTTVLIIGIVLVLYYREHTATERQTAELENENRQLTQVVDRLTDEHRVADMLVTGQTVVNGIPQTTLLFEEYAKNRSTLPPKIFTIQGDQVHVDAMVIKFDRDFVKQNDPLRGHSIALFTKIYGNHQSPDQGSVIDTPGKIPGYYQGIDPRVGQFELGLWNDFWKLARDADYRSKMGVRVSNGQSVWWPCEMNQLYTLTIESDGGLNVTFEPIKGIFQEALKQKAGSGL
jgi:hypothetical protein